MTWWDDYIAVKHHRDAQYRDGKLASAIDAVAGLFVLLLYNYADEARNAELVPTPLLLRPGRKYCGGMSLGSFDLGIAYKLDGA